MEGEVFSAFNMTTARHYGSQELQSSMTLLQNHNPEVNQLASIVPTANYDVKHPQMSKMLDLDNNCDKGQDVVGQDDEIQCEKRILGQTEISEGSLGCPRQRARWTVEMVKVLLTALSYIKEETSSVDVNDARRKQSVLQKIGKWKCVSRVMRERGYYVSQQQCQDKFNDLYRRYRRLNDLLGRGTSCIVVGNPKLLDVMDIDEQTKEDARKILNSRYLCYEQMCSYINGNRLYLPHDFDLLLSLQLILWGKDVCGQKMLIEEKELEIKSKMVKLQRMQHQCQILNWKRSRELEKMRLENERLELENEQMALQFKRKAITIKNYANKRSGCVHPPDDE